jgi:predicted nicotinamide N-methyase
MMQCDNELQEEGNNEEQDEPWIEAQGGLYHTNNAITSTTRLKANRINAGIDRGEQDKNEQVDREEEDNDDDDWQMNHSLFADPDPIQEFHLEWQVELPLSNSVTSLSAEHQDATTNPNTNIIRTIAIDVRGHKPENGQTLSSTGLTLWRGSELLCNYLLQHAPELFHYNSNSSFSSSTRVLELGAGLGVCGILAHLLGASHVVLTDGDSETLQWLRANVQRNAKKATTNTPSTTMMRITCAQLQWGLHLERFQQRHGISCFDIIMASDVIYVEEILHPLWQTIQILLSKGEGGRFLLSFVRRNVSWDLVLQVADEYDMELLLDASGKRQEFVDGVFVFKRKQRNDTTQQGDE